MTAKVEELPQSEQVADEPQVAGVGLKDGLEVYRENLQGQVEDYTGELVHSYAQTTYDNPDAYHPLNTPGVRQMRTELDAPPQPNILDSHIEATGLRRGAINSEIGKLQQQIGSELFDHSQVIAMGRQIDALRDEHERLGGLLGQNTLKRDQQHLNERARRGEEFRGAMRANARAAVLSAFADPVAFYGGETIRSNHESHEAEISQPSMHPGVSRPDAERRPEPSPTGLAEPLAHPAGSLGAQGSLGEPDPDLLILPDDEQADDHPVAGSAPADETAPDLGQPTRAEAGAALKPQKNTDPDYVASWEGYLARARDYINTYDQYDMTDPQQREDEAYAMAYRMYERDHKPGLGLVTRIKNFGYRLSGNKKKSEFMAEPYWYEQYVKVWEEEQTRAKAEADAKANTATQPEQGSNASGGGESAATGSPPNDESLAARAAVWLRTAYSKEADQEITSEYKAGFYNERFGQQNLSRAYRLGHGVGKFAYATLWRLHLIPREGETESDENRDDHKQVDENAPRLPIGVGRVHEPRQ